ncbi:sugar ABC transporter substrate-binding protein [Micromonospora costi]|uniref:Sugar ABC transporter substrate-binding protein n=2 Tax=Micromonospora costi TaxID=1530042 RepID=A0A3A9ZXF2_9ACTN|nr:sugar ABC transporter substrate-binding protein [Micromonospora costi]
MIGSVAGATGSAVGTARRARSGVRPVVALAAGATAALMAVAGCSDSTSSSSAAGGTDTFTIGVVEQQLSNPFFLTIQNAVKDEAKKQGIKVITAESKTAGDSATQLTAIQDMINRGVKGIIIDPANATALVDVIKQARSKGILVVAVNTETDPVDAVDATFETDNLAAGKLIGQWAKAQVGSAAPKVAMLDYDLTDRTSKQRHDGFLQGFGLSEGAPEIVAEKQTEASVSGGQAAMENMLQARKDINVVYGINEPMAQGAHAAIAAQNLTNVTIVGIDGSCSGVAAVKNGEIGATVAQFPSKMGEMALDTIVQYVKDGTKPSGVINSGTVLITDKAVPGIDSKDTDWGLQNCWGSK